MKILRCPKCDRRFNVQDNIKAGTPCPADSKHSVHKDLGTAHASICGGILHDYDSARNDRDMRRRDGAA